MNNPFAKIILYFLFPNIIAGITLWWLPLLFFSYLPDSVIFFFIMIHTCIFFLSILTFFDENKLSTSKKVFYLFYFTTIYTLISVLSAFLIDLNFSNNFIGFLLFSPIGMFFIIGMVTFSKKFNLSNIFFRNLNIALILFFMICSIPSIIDRYNHIQWKKENSSSSSSSSSKKSFSRSEVYSWYSSSYPSARIMVDSAGDNWRVTIIYQSGSSKIINVPKYQ